MARAIQDEGSSGKALSALAAALAQVGDGRSAAIFDEAGEVARAIQDEGSSGEGPERPGGSSGPGGNGERRRYSTRRARWRAPFSMRRGGRMP